MNAGSSINETSTVIDSCSTIKVSQVMIPNTCMMPLQSRTVNKGFIIYCSLNMRIAYHLDESTYDTSGHYFVLTTYYK